MVWCRRGARPNPTRAVAAGPIHVYGDHGAKKENGRIMATKVIIQHPINGLTKNGYFGYSWTYLFFGWWVPLFRGELGVAALHLLFSIFTLGIWQFVVSFLYNKQYMTRMLEKGYILKDAEGTMSAARIRLGIADLRSA